MCKSESEKLLVKDLEKFRELKDEVEIFYDIEMKPLVDAEDLIGLRKLSLRWNQYKESF